MSPTATLLERLGLPTSSEVFERLATDGDSLVDAWRSPHARASDLAWLVSRIVADNEHRTVLSLAFLGASGARVGVKELEDTIAFVTAALLDPDETTLAQIALLASRVLERGRANDWLAIGPDGTIVTKANEGIPYVIVWLTLHCVLITIQAGCPLKASLWARQMFQLIETLPGADQVAEFLRETIPFDDFESKWIEVITRNAAKA